MERIEILEKRVTLLENVVDAMVNVLCSTQPNFVQEQINAICDKWDMLSQELEKE